MIDVEKVEVVTVYRGKDMATYLASDIEKHGIENSEPIRVSQYPGDDKPFRKIYIDESDGWYEHTEVRAKKGASNE